MLTDGLKLMVVGLSTVFVFLAFMILIISMLAKVLLPFAKAIEPVRSPAVRPNRGGVATEPLQEDKAIVAAIMTAVCRFRADRKKK